MDRSQFLKNQLNKNVYFKLEALQPPGSFKLRGLLWHEIKCAYYRVVSDEAAERGSRVFAKEQRLLVELSSGAALSIVCDNHEVLNKPHTITKIVWGGINTTHFQL